MYYLWLPLNTPIRSLNHLNSTFVYNKLFFLQILKSFEFPSPMLIQAYGWPGILKLNNVVGISPVKTGKTFTYLCPLVSELLQTQTYKELAVGNGVSQHNKAFDRCIWHLFMYTEVLLLDSIWCKSLLYSAFFRFCLRRFEFKWFLVRTFFVVAAFSLGSSVLMEESTGCVWHHQRSSEGPQAAPPPHHLWRGMWTQPICKYQQFFKKNCQYKKHYSMKYTVFE